ncbi:MAG TPA: tyrosine-type recombinase/integrase [Xylanibacter oryzae]|uniref:tyrosine-type recombinase/integrase n=1 Tax=Xylanibacter oryzae TaxID=185293 RepID=UPI0004B199F1|nr:tyrosine-type recombinase/integrase [Xylanibacter oryzae]HRN15947.1 tyrosine-type recombinase/integrase [Xylanibacter oryzae]
MMIKQFLNYLQYERNYSILTLQSYGRDLESFESYFKNLGTHLSWESVDSDIIRDWIESMMDKGNTATSINRRLSALRSFYRFAMSQGLVLSDPVRTLSGPKKSKPLPQFLKEKEIDELLDGNMFGSSFKDVRAYTIIMMFYETGIRLSELINMEKSSVDLVDYKIKVTGKRNKQRIIPFGRELADAIKRYLEIRQESLIESSDSMFVTDRGKPMNRNQVRYEVSKYLKMVCTLKKCTPHVLRHTFATAMLNHNANLESVKKLLGHQSLTTTEVYTHTTFEQLKKVYNQAHPRA